MLGTSREIRMGAPGEAQCSGFFLWLRVEVGDPELPTQGFEL